MDGLTRWYLVRHAPVKKASQQLYRTADEPADVGRTDLIAGLAATLPADAVLLTSPLKRTRQTADAVVDAGFAPAERHEDARLAEQDYGRWYGQDIAELDLPTEPEETHKFWFTDAETLPPDGERFTDVIARVSEALVEQTARFAGRRIVAVTHGGVIRAALSHALGIAADRTLAISVETLSTTRIDHKPGPGKGGDWRLIFVNTRPVPVRQAGTVAGS